MANRKTTWLTETSRMCPLMRACDGNVLKPGREICGPCEQAEKRKRNAKNKLRGERHLEYEESRRHDTRRT